MNFVHSKAPYSDVLSEGFAHSDATQAGATRADLAHSDFELDIVSLYPRNMNIYGDSGNVLTVTTRAQLKGYQPRIHHYNQGDEFPQHADIIIGGGGQDSGQKVISDDLFKRSDTLRELANEGAPMLLICGMYQLFGQYFETIDGARLEGIGILGVHTVASNVRMIGNLSEHCEHFGTLIGYENHSGQTFLDADTQPLGRVAALGTGNNGEDRTEGARWRNVIGTYLHGSLLPKNPRVADFLIETAAERRYGAEKPQIDAAQRKQLEQLDAAAEQARRVALQRPR